MIYHHQHCWQEEYLELDTWLLWALLIMVTVVVGAIAIVSVVEKMVLVYSVLVPWLLYYCHRLKQYHCHVHCCRCYYWLCSYCHHPHWNQCYVMFVSRRVFFIIIIIKSYSTNQHLFNIISVQSREPQTSMIYTPYRKKTNNSKKSSMTTPLFNKIIKHLPPVRSIPSAKVFKWGSCIRTTSGGRW